MKGIISKTQEAIAQIDRTLAGIEDQIAYANGVLQCLIDEGFCTGSASSVRSAEQIDEEDAQVRAWIRTLRAHRSKLLTRKSKLEDHLTNLRVKMFRAKAQAEQEQNERKARVSG